MSTKPALAILAILAFASRVALGDPQVIDPSRSIVKVFANQRRPDLHRPWTHHPTREVNGSGVVIEGNRILTNAQVVKYSSRTLVEPNQSGEKLAATVEFLADDLDLAILKLEDPAFFETHPPLRRRPELPRIKDVVLAYGYPLGGENLSITRGIVSRIDFEEYYYRTMGLRVQVDAAINSGNSGGPALVDDRMIGIIFNRLDESDNIGYIIPNEEIDLFLKDVADGRYDGKPQITEELHVVENKALRKALKLPKEVNGMICPRPKGGDPASSLKPLDVIAAIGEHPIDVAGKIKAGEDLRVDFRYAVQKLATNGRVPLKVYRDGSPIDLMLATPEGPARPLVLPPLMGRELSYLVWGPLAFAAATEDYLNEFDREGMASQWYPYMTYNQSPLLSRRGDSPRFDGEQLVVAVGLFPHRTSKGYISPTACVVDTVDGTRVRNLRHLGELLLAAKGERIAITFVDKRADLMIFDRKEVADTVEEILNENGIRSACSDDLGDLFKGPR